VAQTRLAATTPTHESAPSNAWNAPTKNVPSPRKE
jgi:hypothetical protein